MANQTTSQRNGKTETPDLSDLNDQLEKLREDLTGVTKIVSDLATSKADQVAANARASLAAARDRGEALSQEAQDHLIDLGNDATDYVRRNPVPSLAIAAGLGLIVGFLSRRN